MGFLKKIFGGLTGKTDSLSIALDLAGRITPTVWAAVQDGVSKAEAKGGTGPEKRAYALKQTATSLKAIGKEVLPNIVNFALELAVAALRK